MQKLAAVLKTHPAALVSFALAAVLAVVFPVLFLAPLIFCLIAELLVVGWHFAKMRISDAPPAPIKRTWQAIIAGYVLGLIWAVIWDLRALGIFRGPWMIVYRHPALFTLPFLAALGGLLVHVTLKMVFGDRYGLHLKPEPRPVREPDDDPFESWSHVRHSRDVRAWEHRERRRQNARLNFTGTVITWFLCGIVGLIVAAVWTGGWTEQAIYAHINYGPLTPAMLAGSDVRIKPYDVAVNQIDASYNSSTHAATNVNMVLVGGKMTWTAIQDPEGFGNTISGNPASGIITDGAESSSTAVAYGNKQTSGSFRYSTTALFGSNLGWVIHKRYCYTCDITEVVAMPTSSGPVLVAPYVTWQGGLFVKRPVFSGVFIENTRGQIKRENAKQAEHDPTLLASGHVFPASQARHIAEAYAYRYGIWNRVFSHKGQYGIADTEETNAQPYFEDLKYLGPSWVTTLEPHGRTYTTGAVMVTSAITGRTRIWRTPTDSSYIGNDKALSIVQGQTGMGITFNTGTSQGNFDTIEPRQVFPPHHGLQFLVSVAPNAETKVSLNIVVDSLSQSVVAVFQADAQGDQDLVNYLNTGSLPASEQFNGAGAGNSTGLTSTPTQTGGQSQTGVPTPVAPSPAGAPRGSGAVQTIQRLLDENLAAQQSNRSQLAGLKAQEQDLLRLLAAARKSQQR